MATITDKQARQWGMLSHLAALGLFIGIPFGNVIGPLLIWLLKKDDHPFIADQARESLNFQISLFIYGICAGILVLLAIGFLFLIAIGVMAIVFPVIAAYKASAGLKYRYPLTIRFLK